MNKSKQKGTRFESEVVGYLNARGVNCERSALHGSQDRGDIAGIPGWTIECKNQQSLTWAEWCDQTERERRNAGAQFGLLVVRRRLKIIERAYAVLPLKQAVSIILDDIECR